MEENKFKQKQELKRMELLYYQLPNLLHKILHISLMPTIINREILNKEIEEIKKITNTECKSALSYFEELI